MDMHQALTEIDGVLENHYLNVREFSEEEAEEFQLCVDKLHEILADYCSLKKTAIRAEEQAFDLREGIE